MKTNRRIIITLIVSLMIANVQAQQASPPSSSTGVGFRFGFQSGITLKHFISEKRAWEGIATFNDHGFAAIALYEIHQPIQDIANLDWFYGIGAHAGIYNHYYKYKYIYYYDQYYETRYVTSYPSLGVDGIIGIEYKIKEIPFTLELDIKPAMDILNPYFSFLEGAVSVRYLIK